MASYGYGYSGYGYHSYGYNGYDYDNGYYGQPIPNATIYLIGPGTYYYIGRPYASSYAYETQAGGIYNHTDLHTDTGYIDSTSYRLSDNSYKLTESYTYENFTDRSGPLYGPGYGLGLPYTSGYSYPDIYEVSSTEQTQNYVGSIDYISSTDSSSIEGKNGYNYSSYFHSTSIFENGHLEAGSGYSYYVSAVTDPYGYTTYSSHTSTF